MKKQAILFSGALILLIIGIALVVYFFTRKSKTEETGDLPTVKDAGIELVLNPGDAANKVEEYSIFTREYAIGETTAKNIDIKLTWTNGPTFASVGSLIFVHKAKGNKVREDVKTTDNIDSNATNELIFKGEQLTSEDIVGDNTIDMYWNEVKESNHLTTISFKITQEHLDTTLNLANASTIDIPVQLSSSSEASGAVTATHTKYRILPFFTDLVHIRKTSANDKGFHVIKGDQKQTIDGVDTFYIVKALGKDFISKDVSGNNILNGNTKKFVTKNDIFGDVDIMNSSAITLDEVKSVDSCNDYNEYYLVKSEQGGEKYFSYKDLGVIQGYSWKDNTTEASVIQIVQFKETDKYWLNIKNQNKEDTMIYVKYDIHLPGYEQKLSTNTYRSSVYTSEKWKELVGSWADNLSLKCIKNDKVIPLKEAFDNFSPPPST